jgi:hypothetical protein
MKLQSITRRKSTVVLATLLAVVAVGPRASAQSADWTEVIWREPQVRYLLADMTGSGKTDLYRNNATEERDPDSREAIRLWDAGVRVINMGEFERKWVTNQFGKDGRVFRVVQRGSDRTITGNEVLLTSDLGFQDSAIRVALLHFTLGKPLSESEGRKHDVNTAEAIRRWKAGGRVLNTNWFEMRGAGIERRVYYKGTDRMAEGSHIRLNCDLAYPEVNVRYFLADMMLGGSRDFYHRTAESAHEMGCQEAVARFDGGVKVTNLDQFERKKVDGKIRITRKGSNQRISGNEVKLSSD